MRTILFAGASFPCGVSSLADVAKRNQLEPVFLEHKHQSKDLSRLNPLIIGDRIPDELMMKSMGVINLMESWVTESSRHSQIMEKSFGSVACDASRSKVGISGVLKKHMLPVVTREYVQNKEHAVSVARELGFPIVLRPDSAYSSHGVFVSFDEAELRTNWSRFSVECSSHKFGKVRMILGNQNTKAVIEPYLAGPEWSADCIVSKHGTKLIRVCSKVTELDNGRPVHKGYWLETDQEKLTSFSFVIRKWTEALFPENDYLTFITFDIRKGLDGHFIPIDFSVRLGFSSVPYLVRAASLIGNPYAEALRGAIEGGACTLEYAQNWGAVRGPFTAKSLDRIVNADSRMVIKTAEGLLEQNVMDPMDPKSVFSIVHRFKDYREFMDMCDATLNHPCEVTRGSHGN